MVDLSRILGEYNPYIDGWLDPNYIASAILLFIFVWVTGIMLINLVKSFLK